MVSTRKKKNQQKKQFSQLNKTSNDFIFGDNTNMEVTENANLEQHAKEFLEKYTFLTFAKVFRQILNKKPCELEEFVRNFHSWHFPGNRLCSQKFTSEKNVFGHWF